MIAKNADGQELMNPIYRSITSYSKNFAIRQQMQKKRNPLQLVLLFFYEAKETLTVKIKTKSYLITTRINPDSISSLVYVTTKSREMHKTRACS